MFFLLEAVGKFYSYRRFPHVLSVTIVPYSGILVFAYHSLTRTPSDYVRAWSLSKESGFGLVTMDGYANVSPMFFVQALLTVTPCSRGVMCDGSAAAPMERSFGGVLDIVTSSSSSTWVTKDP